jgi:hypothetical protein
MVSQCDVASALQCEAVRTVRLKPWVCRYPALSPLQPHAQNSEATSYPRTDVHRCSSVVCTGLYCIGCCICGTHCVRGAASCSLGMHCLFVWHVCLVADQMRCLQESKGIRQGHRGDDAREIR